MKRALLLIWIIILISGTCGAGTVSFSDANFEAAIADALGVTPPITMSQMESMDELNALSRFIYSVDGLEYATNLEALSLADNYIEDISPIGSLTKLRILWLGVNRNITDISSLSTLTNLNELNLGLNRVSDLSALWNLQQLEYLYLSNNRIVNVADLAGLVNLKKLTLGTNEVSDISAVAGMTNLELLHLGNNQIEDISALTSFTNLQWLDLRDNPLNEDAYNIYIPQIFENNPGILFHYDPIPEPATIFLFGLGSLALLRKQRAE